MLNRLQNHIESEETRWQSQLRQKESEVTSLRVELNDMQAKLIADKEVRVYENMLSYFRKED
jgi:ribosome-binding protein 1